MTIRYPLRILLLGLGLGWAFDLLFWGKMPGVSLLIYTLLLLASLFLVLRWQQVQPLRPNLWMPALLILFAIMAFVRANPFLIFLNILAMLTLLVLISNNLVRKSTLLLRIRDLIFDPIRSVVFSLRATWKIVAENRRILDKDVGERRSGNLRAVLVGLLISIPILLVLIPLLASADMIFAQLIRELFAWDRVLEWGFRIAFMIIIGLLVSGALLYAAQKELAEPDLFDAPAADAPQATFPRLGIIETLIPINLVNLLFLVFVVIQIPYLFGGELNISERKFTYAEYARRGFAELVVVAVFIFGVIVLLHWLSHLQSRRARLAFNLSATLLLLQTMVLLVSAFKRLALYESVYGYTTMRIYPHVFMIWLGLLLLWFAGTLWLAPKRLAIGILTAAFGFVLTLNILNPDAFIVRQNIARFRERGQLAIYDTSGGIDVHYLSRLSADSVPALLDELPNLTGSLHESAAESLRDRYSLMSSNDSWRKWQSYNYSRHLAYNLLRTRFETE